MRLRLRLLLILIASLWHNKMIFLDESVLTFRVLPNDIDLRKMTNDLYIALMDLGRMDIAFCVGLLKPMLKNKWIPLATFDIIRFRHFLKVFQKYNLHTKILYWDNKTFYFRQQFERQNRIVATGYVCATCLGNKGPVVPEKVIASTGQTITKPRKPVQVSMLQALEKNIHDRQKELN